MQILSPKNGNVNLLIESLKKFKIRLKPKKRWSYQLIRQGLK
jgi:hypothetical protein